MIFERPQVFFLLFAVPPAFFYTYIRIRKTAAIANSAAGTQSILRRLYLRSVLWLCAWISAVTALAGPLLGTEAVPVQRSGSAVCFVFDISYSMTASDASKTEKTSRLELSKKLAIALLERFNGTAVAAVLAKGDGVLALPLTEDYNAAENLIRMLSPAMLSAPGSSIAAGIDRALDAFPPQSARNSCIVVFTDGDETEGSISRSCTRAGNFGVQVVLAGTGGEKESEILAGDGKTRVKTALRKSKLEKAAEAENVFYTDAADKQVLETILELIGKNSARFYGEKAAAGTGYEIQARKHHRFFSALSLICFSAGFAAVYIRRTKKTSRTAAVSVLLLFLYTSCSPWTQEGGAVLAGVYHWTQQDYHKASASFLDAVQRAREVRNEELLQYALYGLGTSYLMQNENTAACAKFDEIAPDATPAVLFAVQYNKGVLSYRSGNFSEAAEYFKNALLVDASNLDAKINLELSLAQKSLKSKPAAGELTPADIQNAPPGAENTVFSLIRENDQKRWKNMYSEPASGGAADF